MEQSLRSAAIVSRLRIFAQSVSILSILVGCVVLASWFLGFLRVTVVVPGLASMKANTAICLALCGLAIWLIGRDKDGIPRGMYAQRVGQCCALVVFAAALATVGEYLFRWNLGVDQLLVKDRLGDGHSIAGRMAPNTAICFLLLGAALALSALKSQRGVRAAQYLSMLAVLISTVAVLGYLYSVISLYRIASYSGMALHTALTLVLLSLAALFSPAESGLPASVSSDTLGGVALRRLLPGAFFVPIVIGWLRMEGQKAGWYGTEAGLALMVTVCIMIFSIVVYLSALEIDRIALARQQTEYALKQSQEGLFAMYYTSESIVEACPLPLVTLDQEARVQVWNRAAEQVFGWSWLQVRGRPIDLAPDDRREEFQTLIEFLKRGEPLSGIQTVLLTRDESRVTVALSGAPILTATRGFSGCVLIMEDVTHRLAHAGPVR